jgi:hypothetical protein
MKCNEIILESLDANVEKKMQRVVKSATKVIRKFSKDAKISVQPVSAFEVKLIADMNKFMHPEDLHEAINDIHDAISSGDTNGHIASLVYEGVGKNFLDSILPYLKPGTTIKAEALFPDLIWRIKWKNVVTSKR